jgi:hypothetical protein
MVDPPVILRRVGAAYRVDFNVMAWGGGSCDKVSPFFPKLLT